MSLQSEQRRHEGAGSAVARAIEDGACNGEGGTTASAGVVVGGGANEVDEAREDAGDLERDGEEGPNGGVLVSGARTTRCSAVHRGEKPPRRPIRRRRAD